MTLLALVLLQSKHPILRRFDCHVNYENILQTCRSNPNCNNDQLASRVWQILLGTPSAVLLYKYKTAICDRHDEIVRLLDKHKSLVAKQTQQNVVVPKRWYLQSDDMSEHRILPITEIFEEYVSFQGFECVLDNKANTTFVREKKNEYEGLFVKLAEHYIAMTPHYLFFNVTKVVLWNNDLPSMYIEDDLIVEYTRLRSSLDTYTIADKKLILLELYVEALLNDDIDDYIMYNLDNVYIKPHITPRRKNLKRRHMTLRYTSKFGFKLAPTNYLALSSSRVSKHHWDQTLLTQAFACSVSDKAGTFSTARKIATFFPRVVQTARSESTKGSNYL